MPSATISITGIYGLLWPSVSAQVKTQSRNQKGGAWHDVQVKVGSQREGPTLRDDHRRRSPSCSHCQRGARSTRSRSLGAMDRTEQGCADHLLGRHYRVYGGRYCRNQTDWAGFAIGWSAAIRRGRGRRIAPQGVVQERYFHALRRVLPVWSGCQGGQLEDWILLNGAMAGAARPM